MITSDAAYWSTVQQAKAIQTGKFSSRELLELLVERESTINKELNAIVTLDLDRARSAADAADAALSRGQSFGPLHGIPVTIKDALETEGLRSTGGAKELSNHVPDRDAPVVEAIKSAGAIVFGKTNLPRWSGDIQSYNDLFGTTVNPWNSERVPGGSSGGAAAAVSAGLSSFEIGTDIGGSIRFPASFCGIYGHKPSFGIIPSTGYLDHIDGGLTEADVNVIGPLARSAEDLELLTTLMLRQRGPLVTSLPPAPKDLSTLKIAVWLEDDFCPLDSKVLAVLEKAVTNFAATGAHIDRNARPPIETEEAFRTGSWLVTSAMLQSMPAQTLNELGEKGAPPAATHREWLDHDLQRQKIRLLWAQFFTQYDAIIMPISPVSPFPHNQEGNFATRTLSAGDAPRPYSDLVKWTILTGMAYLPSTTAPVGLDSDGLPVSFQVVGPHGSDYMTIRLAEFIAQHNLGYQPPPVE